MPDVLRRFFGSAQLERARQNHRSCQIELERLAAPATPEHAGIVNAAGELLAEAVAALDGHDVNGAWHFVNAARRTMTRLQPKEELSDIIAELGPETHKLSKWRRAAIEAVLEGGHTYSAVVTALRIRDDAYETRYHRVTLLKGQLQLVVEMSIAALAAILVMVATAGAPIEQWGAWSGRLLGVTLAFGVLGACVSAGRSLTASALQMNIPELVATNTLAAARIILGGTPGLVAYVFLQSGAIKVGGGLAGALTVAFVGGFSERLIVRVAESIGGDSKQPPAQ